MNERENQLRAVRFERPERIPLSFGMNASCYAHYPWDALQDLKEAHPLLFPGFRRTAARGVLGIEDYAPHQQVGRPYTDSWGCVWETTENGRTGVVVKPALADWDAFDGYTPPDPETQDGWGPIDWEAIRRRIAGSRRAGGMTGGRLRHGHTFLTLTYLRGYENLLYDMADGHPRLPALIDMVETFNRGQVERYLDAGIEWMHYPEDLGMQVGPMLSPELFRRYIKPSYERLMAPARTAGCVISMHSDGDIRALMPDLLDAGIESINLQDLVNGIDWMKSHLKGRIFIALDIDRQRITPYGTPAQIDAHIRHCVEELGSREGGLGLQYGLYPGVSLPNIKALMDAMEKYALFFG